MTDKNIKTSKAQLKANLRWKDKNISKQRLYEMRSKAKGYIRDYITTKEEIEDLRKLLDEKEKEI